MSKSRRYLCAILLGITSPLWLTILCVAGSAFVCVCAWVGIVGMFFDEE